MLSPLILKGMLNDVVDVVVIESIAGIDASALEITDTSQEYFLDAPESSVKVKLIV